MMVYYVYPIQAMCLLGVNKTLITFKKSLMMELPCKHLNQQYNAI